MSLSLSLFSSLASSCTPTDFDLWCRGSCNVVLRLRLVSLDLFTELSHVMHCVSCVVRVFVWCMGGGCVVVVCVCVCVCAVSGVWCEECRVVGSSA